MATKTRGSRDRIPSSASKKNPAAKAAPKPKTIVAKIAKPKAKKASAGAKRRGKA